MAEFKLGDQVIRKSTGESGTVVRAAGDQFEVVFPSTGKVTVGALDLVLDTSDPFARLRSGELASATEYGLRLQAHFLKFAYKFDPLSGLTNARVELMPHQVFLAHRVGRKPRARMILSDEVGLGKTVEAGLILKEQIARGLAERVLVICPASLQIQWQREFKSKFNEDFVILDGDAVRFLEKDGSNPWMKHAKVITSVHLARREDRALQISEATWDFVIFDEAHHARRKYEAPGKVTATQAYRLIDELKELAEGLLLLSATPMQLHPYELYSMIELVEPGLYPSFDAYEKRRKSLPKLNELMRNLQEWDALPSESRGAVLGRHSDVLEELGVNNGMALDDRSARESVIDRLTQLHPLAQVLVRNRKSVIGGFKRRDARRVPVEQTPAEQSVYDEVTDYIREYYDRAVHEKNFAVGFLMVLYQKMLSSSSNALRSSLVNRVAKLRSLLTDLDQGTRKRKKLSESVVSDLKEGSALDEVPEALLSAELRREGIQLELSILETLIRRLGKLRDSKAEVLIEKIVKPILEGDSSEKILIFTTFKQTQALLADYLSGAGVSTVVFHGGLNLEQKEDSVRRFRNEASVMISTEAGGEGRNFQFARNLVNYDLPWNPMVVEQRIGRLDRIGQLHDVRIFNLFNVGTVEERVLTVLDERIGLFEESVGSLDPILGDVEDSLEHLIMSRSDSSPESFDKYGTDLESKIKLAREAERLFGDFILDRASFRSDEAQELLKTTPLAQWSDLEAFVASAVDYYGGRLSDHSEGGNVLSLAPVFKQHLRLENGTIRGAFDPSEALQLEDIDFFSFGHSAVDSIIGFASANRATCAALRMDNVPSGVHVEVIYQLESNGLVPKGKLVRHLVDEGGKILEEEINAMPSLGHSCSIRAPGWVNDALEISELRVRGTQNRLRSEVELDLSNQRSVALEREQRLFEYQQSFLERSIRDKEEWIQEAEKHGASNQKRILPAQRGKLSKLREKQGLLELMHNEKVETIRSQSVDVTRKVIAVGLVVGP